ncbi:MAG: hypothetical protein U1F41_16185 [Burkholderiales bacterium]
MTQAAQSIGALYRVQLRTWATLANFALRRASQYNDAGIEAARQAIESNLERCDALLAADGANRWPVAFAPDGAAVSAAASQWQRRWIDMAAQTQSEMTEVLDQLVADWSALPRATTEAPVAEAAPVAFGSVNQLFDSMMRSWGAAMGAASTPAAPAEAPASKAKRPRNGSR